MTRYVCPEGDYELEVPGICPTHGLDLEEVNEDVMPGEESDETTMTGEDQTMEDEDLDMNDDEDIIDENRGQ